MQLVATAGESSDENASHCTQAYGLKKRRSKGVPLSGPSFSASSSVNSMMQAMLASRFSERNLRSETGSERKER